MNSWIVTKESLKRKNFNPEDFFRSLTAQRLKINNQTDDISILSSLMVVADKIQEVRDLLGFSVQITSAYRCRELNKSVGSKDNSQHIQGQAVDFICPQFGTPEKIIKFLKEKGVLVDQCLHESRWVHLSIKHNQNRNMFGSYLNDKFMLIND